MHVHSGLFLRHRRMRTLPLYLLTGFLSLGTLLSGQNDDKSVLTSDVEMLVFQIANHNSVEEAFVGFAGTKSRQYSRYKKLSEVASTEELVALTSHNKAQVRVYAYWALSSRKDVDIEEITKKMKNDNESVEYMSGCIISTVSVKDIYNNAKPSLKTINTGGIQIKGIPISKGF